MVGEPRAVTVAGEVTVGAGPPSPDTVQIRMVKGTLALRAARLDRGVPQAKVAMAAPGVRAPAGASASWEERSQSPTPLSSPIAPSGAREVLEVLVVTEAKEVRAGMELAEATVLPALISMANQPGAGPAEMAGTARLAQVAPAVAREARVVQAHPARAAACISRVARSP